MTLLTFQDIKTGLGPNASNGFTCIGFLSDQPRTRCTISAGLKLEDARTLIREGVESCAKLRTLISCLLCEKDRRSTDFKNSLLQRWCNERDIPYKKIGRPRKSSGTSSERPASSRTGLRSTTTSKRSKSPFDADSRPDTPCPAASELFDDSEVNSGDQDQADELVDLVRSTKSANESYHRQLNATRTEVEKVRPATWSVKSLDAARQAPSLSADEDSKPSHDSEDDIETEHSSQGASSEEEDDDLPDDFVPGKACDWDPGTVRHSLLEIFFRPLNASPPRKGSTCGYVYAAPVLGYRQAIVKIGHTTDGKAIHTVKARLQDVARQHGVQIDFSKTVAFFQNSKAMLGRLEKTVHAELAEYQLIRQCKSTTAKEYYAVDVEAAATTISRWKKRMEQLELREGCSLDPCLRELLTSRHEAFLPESRDEKTAWFTKRIAGKPSHEERQRVWQEIFQDCDGGVKATLCAPLWFSRSIWAAAFVTCLALYFALYHNSSPLALILFSTSHYWRTDWSSWNSMYGWMKKKFPLSFGIPHGGKANIPQRAAARPRQ